MTDIFNNANEMTDTQSDAPVELSDESLQSIAGGCSSNCGLTTWLSSCVSPGSPCP